MPSFVSFPPFSASPTCVVDVRSFLFWRFLSDFAKRQRRSRQTQQKPPLPPSKKRHTHTHGEDKERKSATQWRENTTPLAPQQIARQLPHNSPLLCQISQSSGEIFCASSYTCRKLQRTRMSLRQRCSAPAHKTIAKKGCNSIHRKLAVMRLPEYRSLSCWRYLSLKSSTR